MINSKKNSGFKLALMRPPNGKMQLDELFLPLSPDLPYVKCEDLFLGRVRQAPSVACLIINRQSKGNAFTMEMFQEFERLIIWLDESLESLDVRALVIASVGPLFSAGIDLGLLKDIYSRLTMPDKCPGTVREEFRRGILKMQYSFTVLEQLRCPVITFVQGPCIGGGVDLITAADIRVCSDKATFCVKEVDVGIVADLGSLARLPNIVGQGHAMDLSLTARTIDAEEALRIGLVTRIIKGSDAKDLLQGAISIAVDLAKKPRLALMGTKRLLVRSRATQVTQDNDHVATWNSAQLINQDLEKIVNRSKLSKL
jgi:enoyl-CoA hydratase/carnithine racemase